MAWLEQRDNQIKKSSDLIVALHNSYRRLSSHENTKWIKYNIVLALMSDTTSKNISFAQIELPQDVNWFGRGSHDVLIAIILTDLVGLVACNQILVITDIKVLLNQGEGGRGSLYPHWYLSPPFFGIFFCTLRQNKSAIQSEIGRRCVFSWLVPLLFQQVWYHSWGSRLM